jgi:hypothetical protein
MYLVIAGWPVVNLLFIAAYAVNRGLGALIFTILFTPFSIFIFIPMLLGTYYEFGEDELIIKSGLGKGIRVAYASIVSATRTKEPISSPALSMDRIEIKYKFKLNKFSDTVIISPKDKQGFFEQLKKKNENIVISPDVKPLSKDYKVFLTIILGFTAVVFISVGLMIVVGIQDPDVYIYDDNIRISGSYGLRVYFSEMTSVSLVNKSMSEIYDGESVSRTNGIGGIGQTNKGHFWSATFGSHRLFVQTRTAPTIHIERRAIDIYISFRDGEKTERLYRELVAALP